MKEQMRKGIFYLFPPDNSMYPPAVGATSGLITLDKQEGQKEGAESTSHSLPF